MKFMLTRVEHTQPKYGIQVIPTPPPESGAFRVCYRWFIGQRTYDEKQNVPKRAGKASDVGQDPRAPSLADRPRTVDFRWQSSSYHWILPSQPVIYAGRIKIGIQPDSPSPEVTVSVYVRHQWLMRGPMGPNSGPPHKEERESSPIDDITEPSWGIANAAPLVYIFVSSSQTLTAQYRRDTAITVCKSDAHFI
ncbi:uncharacterized protein An03g02200 [Aspergillus niger]|uniref:Contig An03c0070, genomic contig n=2 Tax=Aspergillus niger TaxID=5061 RepID=A2QG80_ASPNC|nr:uncharacterized protein An03g02200 [Aspergillus niger]CAK38190.1 unnamed protein product [Aspergillus niger]